MLDGRFCHESSLAQWAETTTVRVGTAAPGCPAERSSARAPRIVEDPRGHPAGGGAQRIILVPLANVDPRDYDPYPLPV